MVSSWRMPEAARAWRAPQRALIARDLRKGRCLVIGAQGRSGHPSRPLTQSSAAPSRRSLAAAADALPGPGARKRRLAHQALPGLLLARRLLLCVVAQSSVLLLGHAAAVCERASIFLQDAHVVANPVTDLTLLAPRCGGFHSLHPQQGGQGKEPHSRRSQQNTHNLRMQPVQSCGQRGAHESLGTSARNMGMVGEGIKDGHATKPHKCKTSQLLT